jgi:hypothetical protein
VKEFDFENVLEISECFKNYKIGCQKNKRDSIKVRWS